MSVEPGLVGFAGLAALAMATTRRRPATRIPWPPKGVSRLFGWFLVGLSALIAWLAAGPAIGTVAWIGELSVAGALLVLLLSWRPETAPLAAVLALAAAPIAAGL